MRTCVYALKVWLAAVVTAPFLGFMICRAFHTDDGVSLTGSYWWMGALLSFPAFPVIWLGVNVAPFMGKNRLAQKLLLSLWAAGLTAAPFSIFGILRIRDLQSELFFGFYLLPILLGIWFYRWPHPVSLPEPQITAS
ncbi:hypothetical protein [Dinghuibacter silviterrae]|uniref:Uncharacterized protein n=1 Tax=Dinghuibacter silviterrae TaxID=1539049 RepID=A0A4V3GM28_9BACT|nr:hypothetical protein [Dinghuibacter silviterrae]TDX01803.1 hypothetical protein EDB95_2846 [Dinghuibacter silviterrae]